MLSKAVIKYVRMSPRKVRYVIEPLRYKTVAEALTLLTVINRRAAKPVGLAIASAFANARQKDATVTETQLVISHLTADGGPTWKRFRAAAFGRAVPIRKRTSHIIVMLDRANGRKTAPPPRPVERLTGRGEPAQRPAVKVNPKAMTSRKVRT